MPQVQKGDLGNKGRVGGEPGEREWHGHKALFNWDSSHYTILKIK